MLHEHLIISCMNIWSSTVWTLDHHLHEHLITNRMNTWSSTAWTLDHQLHEHLIINCMNTWSSTVWTLDHQPHEHLIINRMNTWSSILSAMKWLAAKQFLKYRHYVLFISGLHFNKMADVQVNLHGIHIPFYICMYIPSETVLWIGIALRPISSLFKIDRSNYWQSLTADCPWYPNIG